MKTSRPFALKATLVVAAVILALCLLPPTDRARATGLSIKTAHNLVTTPITAPGSTNTSPAQK